MSDGLYRKCTSSTNLKIYCQLHELQTIQAFFFAYFATSLLALKRCRISIESHQRPPISESTLAASVSYCSLSGSATWNAFHSSEPLQINAEVTMHFLTQIPNFM